jgi:hypothetical protein
MARSFHPGGPGPRGRRRSLAAGPGFPDELQVHVEAP